MLNTNMIKNLGLLSKRVPLKGLHNDNNIRKCSDLVKVHLENDNQVAIITLNNPGKMNALTEEMGDALGGRLAEVRGEGSVRAAVITGAGKAFSAGGDLDWLMARHRDTPENNLVVMQEFYKKFLVMREMEVPVIAAINGPAIGAGLCLALGGADIRVASEGAKLGVTFTRLGLHPGMAATHFLPQLVGPQVAAELLLTGRLVDSTEALRLGLVARVAEDAMTAARDVAAMICKAGPVSVRTLTKTLRDRQNCGLEETFRVEASAQAICYPTSDLAEGVTALQEKRNPNFTGQ